VTAVADNPSPAREEDDDASAPTIRVVIADDHAVVRRGLRQVLDSEEGVEVVAEAANLEDARRYVRRHHPTVLVLDLNPPRGPQPRRDPRDPLRVP
jgi:CheY-like chemotaxis protein